MNRQERTISSGWTFFYKVIFTPLWSFLFGVATIAMWLGHMTDSHGAQPPPEMKYLFLVLWLTGTAFITKSCGGLKRVSIRDGKIYISNFRREIAVPLAAVRSVSESRWNNMHPVTIRFNSVTAFGEKITFMPTMRFLNWGRHPIVEELRRMAGVRV